MNEIKFGLQQPEYNFKPETTFDNLKNIIQTAESNGFESFWVMDHLMQIPYLDPESKAPMLEAWVVLSNLAGVTKKIKLGTLVTCASYRNPAHLAKIGATLDVLSGGRVIMGIGAGWFEKEYISYGYSFPKYRERVEMLSEAVQIMKKMWTEESPSFEGKYFRIKDAICNPKPLQKPYPRILIGGGGLETLKVVAEHADMCNFFGKPDEIMKKIETVEKYCSEIGRDPDEITVSKIGGVIIAESEDELKSILKTKIRPGIRPGFSPEQLEGWLILGTPEQVKEKLQKFIDVGVTYFILNFPGSDEIKLHLNKIMIFGERVISEF